MKTYVTVFAVIRDKDEKYLILQRADHRSNPGLWNHVTGFIQDRESAEDAALREMKEETNLEGRVLKTTEPFWADFGDTRWVVIASLIDVKDTKNLVIDENESKDHDWIKLNDKRIQDFKPLVDSFKRLNLIS